MTRLSPEQVEANVAKVRAAIKETQDRNPNAIKVYAPGRNGEGGESFWAERTGLREATVANLCLCGLGVGDKILIRAGGPDEHQNILVDCIEKVCELSVFAYGPEAIKDNRLTPEVVAFLKSLHEKEIKTEGMVAGLLMVQRPIKMTEQELEAIMATGPVKFTMER